MTLPNPIDEILDVLINQIEWSVRVPGSPEIDRPKEEKAKQEAKSALQEIIDEARIDELEKYDEVPYSIGAIERNTYLANRIKQLKDNRS